MKKNAIFSRDVPNAHWYDCTHMNIRIEFVITIFWALIRNMTKTYNDIQFCKEAKMIIVVDK